MASYTSDLKDWGATGTAYPSGYSYEVDVPPVDVYDNFLIDNLVKDVKDHLVPLTNSRIESDVGGSGGEPASPELSHLYHDQGNERLRVWDSSASSWRDLLFRDGDSMQGSLDMDGYQIQDSSGTLTLSGNVNVGSGLSINNNAVATENWTNNNADVPNADYADNSDKLDGNHYSDIQTWVNNNADVPYADHADSAGDADKLDGNHYSDIQTWVNNNADVPNADYADNADAVDGSNVFVQSSQPSGSNGDIWIDTS